MVDEAHEISFKQDDGVRYNARDVAVIRARFEQIPVVLASATPRWKACSWPRRAYTKGRSALALRRGAMPDIQIVDLTQHPPERNHWIAPPLVEKLQDRLDKGEQSLLFLNRRGYAPLTLCRHAAIASSVHDAAHGWWSTASRRLACHHCGHEEPMPTACPECGEAIAWSPAAPAWNASPMKWPRSCHRRAWRWSLRTR
jgi:primosomal protein N' (replication factor Y)